MEVPMTNPALRTRIAADGTWLELPPRAPLPRVHLDSPAEQVMTSTADLAAATVMPHEDLEQAKQRMAQHDVQVVLVVAQMPRVLGVLAMEDIHGEKPLRLVSQRRLAYKDLRVADLMQPVSQLDSIDLRALRHARVAQIVATLSRSGRPHLLVVEPALDSGILQMRGLLSKTQVELQLGIRLPAIAIAGTFAEIEQALI
jgi:CBS-domain-containing membrane protein